MEINDSSISWRGDSDADSNCSYGSDLGDDDDGGWFGGGDDGGDGG